MAVQRFVSKYVSKPLQQIKQLIFLIYTRRQIKKWIYGEDLHAALILLSCLLLHYQLGVGLMPVSVLIWRQTHGTSPGITDRSETGASMLLEVRAPGSDMVRTTCNGTLFTHFIVSMYLIIQIPVKTRNCGCWLTKERSRVLV